MLTTDLSILAGLLLLIIVCEFIDSSVGMGYGTILSPLLIILGYDPVFVVPCILISQAVGGAIATIRHHSHQNANFSHNSPDLKIALLIGVLGIAASAISAVIGVIIPKIYLSVYIGVLVLLMGILVTSGKSFIFSWGKIVGLAVLSAFNKGLSGGGFGPLVTSGQIVVGKEHKSAVGVTTFAEVPVCLAGFLIYLIAHGTSLAFHPLFIITIAGAIIGAIFGPYITKIIKPNLLRYIVGISSVLLGAWTLFKVLK